jgi:hypothetical protein
MMEAEKFVSARRRNQVAAATAPQPYPETCLLHIRLRVVVGDETVD